MGDLLKDTPGSQLFTVFGLPRVKPGARPGKGEWTVEMEGVDIYDPVTNTIHATDAGKVAAWFLDSDYDGRDLLHHPGILPRRSAWEKLASALKTVVDADRFAAFSGTVAAVRGRRARRDRRQGDRSARQRGDAGDGGWTARIRLW